jgi:hypothetical protein
MGYLVATRNALSGDGLDTYLIKAALEYFKKTAGYFDVKILRAVVKNHYRMMKLADDESKFDQYLKAIRMVQLENILYSNSDSETRQKIKSLGELLEEKEEPKATNFVADMVRLIQNPSKSDMVMIYSGTLPAYFLSIGFGPRATILLSGSLFPFPILAGQFPTDPNKDYSATMIKNRKLTVELLKKCISEYEDPAKTADEVKAGDCGIVDFSKVPAVTAPNPANVQAVAF